MDRILFSCRQLEQSESSFCNTNVLFVRIFSFIEAPNRPAIGYEQNANQTTRGEGGTNRSPVRGPLRGSHRATEE
jgi:hypothetical protein